MENTKPKKEEKDKSKLHPNAKPKSGSSSNVEPKSGSTSNIKPKSGSSSNVEPKSGSTPAPNAVAEKKEPKEASSIPPEASSSPSPPPVKKKKESLPFLRINGGKIETSLSFEFTKIKHPDFKPGDTLKVHFRIREGEKQRIQVYEGIVISMRGEGCSRSFVVRRISHDVGVERVFPYYSPSIHKIQVVRRGRVRRSRLYYLRNRKGKEARVKEAFHRTAAKK